jgi:hypothetical protein
MSTTELPAPEFCPGGCNSWGEHLADCLDATEREHAKAAMRKMAGAIDIAPPPPPHGLPPVTALVLVADAPLVAPPSASRTALHSMGTAEWFSPAPYVEASRTLMGGIDLDPASCAEANELIRATRYIDAEEDGLVAPWINAQSPAPCTAFLNPPGGRGLVRAFWDRLVEHWLAGKVEQAIWVGYSLEQLQTLQSASITPLDFPLCYPRKRIAFDAPRVVRDGIVVKGEKRSPTHANYLAYLPPRHPAAVTLFLEGFSQFGRVKP